MPRPLAFDPAEALERATDVFWKQGFEATSLDDLTAAMRINRPSLYNRFGDKHSLYMQALKHYAERHGRAVMQGLEQSKTVRAGFEQLFEAVTCTESACWGCLLVNAATERAQAHPDVQRFVNLAAEENERVFAEALRSGQRRGEINRSKDPEALAKLLYNGVLALRVRARSGASQEALRENAALILKLLG